MQRCCQPEVLIVSKLLYSFLCSQSFICANPVQQLRSAKSDRGVTYLALKRREISREVAGVARRRGSVTDKFNSIIPCCRSCVARVPIMMACFCYPEPCKGF
jgi:hypothetical protein